MTVIWLFLQLYFFWNIPGVYSFHFYTPEGFSLVRKILLGVLPTFEPHSYQIDGVCKVLDKIDLVAVTPTGSGKTGFLFLTILVMIAVAANPSLCPAVTFPKDPAIVVVCPTNSIEQQMVSSKDLIPLSKYPTDHP
jgi:superfamily II DNA or RNA helicase